LKPVKDAVAKQEAELQRIESESNKEAEKQAKELTTNLPAKCSDFLSQIDALVEETKDVTVVLTCELGDHSSPEDVVKVEKDSEATSSKALKLILELKTYLGSAEAAFRSFPDVENVDELRSKVLLIFYLSSPCSFFIVPRKFTSSSSNATPNSGTLSYQFSGPLTGHYVQWVPLLPSSLFARTKPLISLLDATKWQSFRFNGTVLSPTINSI
jgi:hypothetical protein